MFYLADSHIPSNSANATQVLANVESFNSVGLSTELFCISTGKSLKADFKYRGIAFVKIPGFLYFYTIIGLVTAYFSKQKIIYTRYYIGAFISAILGFRTYYEAHGDYWNYSKFPKSWVTKSFKKLGGVVCITNTLKEKLLSDFKVDDQKILVAPDGAHINLKSKLVKLSQTPD